MHSSEKKELLNFAIFLAKQSGALTLNYFRSSLKIDRKDDQSPVTIADRNAEKWMRSQIQETYPQHGIIGEEYGTIGENRSIKWILDPIDGTHSFVHGIPLYTTLIAVTIDDKPEIGVIYAPFTDELCEAATGMGTRYNGKSCKVSETETLRRATLLSTDITTIIKEGLEEPFNSLLDNVYLHRTWGDAYGHMMVASGRADIMFDPVLSIWDAAPLLPVLQEAGGHFFDFNGTPTIDSGQGISCNHLLKDKVLSFMKNER